MKTIQYAIDENGLTWSRVNSELAMPVIDYVNIDGGYDVTYKLEKFKVLDIAANGGMDDLTWTKQIPVSLKNYHRKFWGMSPLKEK